MRACVRACVRVCVRARARARVRAYTVIIKYFAFVFEQFLAPCLLNC